MLSVMLVVVSTARVSMVLTLVQRLQSFLTDVGEGRLGGAGWLDTPILAARAICRSFRTRPVPRCKAERVEIGLGLFLRRLRFPGIVASR